MDFDQKNIDYFNSQAALFDEKPFGKFVTKKFSDILIENNLLKKDYKCLVFIYLNLLGIWNWYWFIYIFNN